MAHDTILVKILEFVDVPWSESELSGLQMRTENATRMLKHSNEQLREAIAEGDSDHELYSAVLENEELIERNELRQRQLDAVLEAMRTAARTGRSIRMVPESDWTGGADRVVQGHGFFSDKPQIGSPPSASAEISVSEQTAALVDSAALAMGMDL